MDFIIDFILDLLFGSHCVQFAVLPALIAGAAALGVGGMNLWGTSNANRANARAVEDTNRTNMALNAQNWNETWRMWHSNNAYNTPLAQRQRYEDAGINPYHALGSINGGNAESQSAPPQQSMQAAHAEPYNFDFVAQAAQNAMNTYFNAQQLKNEQALAAANSRKTNAEAETIELNNNVARLMDQWREDIATWRYKREKYGTEKASHDSYKSFYDYLNSRQAYEFNEDTYGARKDMILTDRLVRQAELTMVNAQATEKLLSNSILQQELSFLPEKQKQELKVLIAQEFNNYAQGRASLTSAAAAMKSAIASAFESNERGKGYQIENKLKSKTFDSDLRKILAENAAAISSSNRESEYNRIFSLDKGPVRALEGWNFFWNKMPIPFVDKSLKKLK